MTARVILGVSGASGAALALDCARALRRAGAAVELVLSAMAERTLTLEIGPGARDELVALADRLRSSKWAGMRGSAAGASAPEAAAGARVVGARVDQLVDHDGAAVGCPLPGGPGPGP